jgi:hypothetical protein
MRTTYVQLNARAEAECLVLDTTLVLTTVSPWNLVSAAEYRVVLIGRSFQVVGIGNFGTAI